MQVQLAAVVWVDESILQQKSHALWIWMGDQNIGFFFRLVKANYAKDVIKLRALHLGKS